VEVLRHVEFAEVLMAWALHEWQGRLRPQLSDAAMRLSPEDARLPAVQALLQVRVNVIAGMVAAGIRDCVRVRVTPEDIPSILVMGARPVAEWSKNKLSEADPSADYARRLADSREVVGGPVLAIGRSTVGPITVFDGMHRIAAWIAHATAGRQYPLEINLVLTERPSRVFELPPD